MYTYIYIFIYIHTYTYTYTFTFTYTYTYTYTYTHIPVYIRIYIYIYTLPLSPFQRWKLTCPDLPRYQVWLGPEALFTEAWRFHKSRTSSPVECRKEHGVSRPSSIGIGRGWGVFRKTDSFPPISFSLPSATSQVRQPPPPPATTTTTWTPNN